LECGNSEVSGYPVLKKRRRVEKPQGRKPFFRSGGARAGNSGEERKVKKGCCEEIYLFVTVDKAKTLETTRKVKVIRGADKPIRSLVVSRETLET
jgi:hypothetical protein